MTTVQEKKEIRTKSKTLECKVCGQDVHNCGATADAVTCSQCVMELYWHAEDAPKRKSVGYPKGWKFMKEFVHENGTVYHKGEEQPDLKGTLQPTPLTSKEPKAKKSKAQRAQEKQEALATIGKLKKELIKEARKTYKKKLETQIKQLQKLI
jgi:hypothetical protein